MKSAGIKTYGEMQQQFPRSLVRNEWSNIGGQIMPAAHVKGFIDRITANKVKSWDEVHKFYISESARYPLNKLQHALGCLQQITGQRLKDRSRDTWVSLFSQAVDTKEWMTAGIYDSRARDYNNSFRRMIYDTNEEMEKVMGKLTENSFIAQEKEAMKQFREHVAELLKKF